MLVAEELEIDLAQVEFEQAPPIDKLYVNPLVGFQVTGGRLRSAPSTSRFAEAGATARTMLDRRGGRALGTSIPARAAQRRGASIHDADGAASSTMARSPARPRRCRCREKVALKDPKDFKLVGTPAKRLDTPAKVNGNAVYGIDAKVPGMKFGTLAACPVFGGKLKSVNDSEALAVKDVLSGRQSRRCRCRHRRAYGRRQEGLAALEIEWDEGPNAKLTTADIVAIMAEVSEAKA